PVPCRARQQIELGRRSSVWQGELHPPAGAGSPRSRPATRAAQKRSAGPAPMPWDGCHVCHATALNRAPQNDSALANDKRSQRSISCDQKPGGRLLAPPEHPYFADPDAVSSVSDVRMAMTFPFRCAAVPTRKLATFAPVVGSVTDSRIKPFAPIAPARSRSFLYICSSSV